ncbi:MAG: glycosyltransferase family 39 protein [Pirellulales bacterium]|nr:glycosyltransferase family 39 protein [Pirellulales bacterium]
MGKLRDASFSWPGVAVFAVLYSVLFISTLYDAPDYFRDSATYRYPDSRHYVQLARNIVDRHVYSRAEQCQGEPDMLRPPLYPLLILSVGGHRLIGSLYLLQGAFVAITIMLLYRITCRIGDRTAGAMAALLCGTDLLLVSSCFFALTEIAFLFFTLLALDVMRWPIVTPHNQEISWKRWCIGGTLVGVSILIRPTNLYLPIIMLAQLGMQRRASGTMTSLWKPALSMIFAFSLVILPWVTRNAVVHGIPRVTTVDKHNLVYLVGAGAYQRQFGWTRNQARAHIAKEYDLPTFSHLQNHWKATDKSVHQMYYEVSDKAMEVVFRHPQALIESLAIGVARASISHVNPEIAYLTGARWRSIRAPHENSMWLYPVLAWQLSHTVTTLILAIVGFLPLGYRRGERWTACALILTLAYYYLTVALFGIDAVARARIPVLPILFVLAGLGGSALIRRWYAKHPDSNGAAQERPQC